MNKITVIGAGKTGRGFVGRLLSEENLQINFIDKDKELVKKLKEAGSFDINFFGNVREKIKVSNYNITDWENSDFSKTELILVSVCGQNLEDVGNELKKRLDINKHYYIITCENASNPSKILKEAIGLPNVSVSEATVFCTTIEGSGLNIDSQNYPYLQCDADLLDGYEPPSKNIKPIQKFGDFLTRKLFTYNAASCIIAYLGWKKGYTDYGEAANDKEILKLLDKNYEITNRVLCSEFGYDLEEQKEFALLSRDKFTDRTIVDTVKRNARQPHRKLGRNERVIGPMLLMDKYGEDTSVLEETVAIMLMYENDGEDEWEEIKKTFTPGEILEKICGIDKENKLYEKILRRYETNK